MKNKILASLGVVLLAGGTLVGTASASTAAGTPVCTTYTARGNSDTLRFVPSTGDGTLSCYLAKGSTGKGVWALQMALSKCNEHFKLEVDKVFGDVTKAAVIELQRKNNITVDGVYGAETRRVMAFYGGANSNGTICRDL